ncbi:MAG TPA: alpha/beta hydrolase fold domain-containing protein [Streptosporangiaceae bacterium]|jgi:acetyl esterase/lipase
MPGETGLEPYVDEARRVLDGLRAVPSVVDRLCDRAHIAELRADSDEQIRGMGAFAPPPSRLVTVDAPSPVPVRVFEPEGAADAVYVEIHGGGWIIGSAAAGDAANAELARTCQVAVVSVDYRLAPEHPHPAAADDCAAVARWLAGHAAGLFGTGRLLVGGASAGATLATLTLLRMRDEGLADRFHGANLAYGPYDMSFTPSQRLAYDTPLIDRAYLEASRPLVFPGRGEEELRAPGVSPLYADLRGLPPALFSVGAYDPFLDDSLFMAARWRAAGGDAELHVYPESPHGFDLLPTGMAAEARRRMTGFLRARARG